MGVQRISLLDVPVDILQPEDLETTIMELAEKKGTKQIVFLSLWDLLKARRKGEFQKCIKNADLIIPISKSIIKGAAFLKKEIPVRYNPFDAVISIMSTLDSHFKSIFLLGSRNQSLYRAEKNVRETFPNLRIVGRHPGYYKKSLESDIVTAIHKASPSLVLYSDGIKDKVCWANKRREQFSQSIFLYYKDVIGIFSKRIQRIDPKTFEKGHEIYHEVIRNPFKILLIFPYLRYEIMLIFYRLFRR